jgi:hypothetical protein
MGGDVDDAVAGLTAALTQLTSASLVGLSRDELLALADAVEAHRRRLAVIDHALVTELEARGTAREVGARDTADLLVQRLHVSRTTARRRVQDAAELAPRVALTGERLPPLRPHVAAAQADGVLGEEHVRVIAKALDALPTALPTEVVAEAEACLVQRARDLEPGQLRVIAQRVLDHLDPDGQLTNEADQQRRRTLWLHRHRDGSAELSGHLTAEAGVKLQTVLDTLSAPAPAEDGTPDERTAAQRRHDALLDVLDRVLRSGTLPDAGGVPTSLVLTASLDQLQQPNGQVRTAHGASVGLTLALRLADTNHTHLLALDDATGELHLGRTSRLAKPALRRALAARDRGCSFPDCTAPPAWCQTHHIVSWLHGGATDIDNLTLLCGHHHRTFETTGWRCRMTRGRPEWIPPTWLDPHQTPRHNHAHHLDDYHFALPTAA